MKKYLAYEDEEFVIFTKGKESEYGKEAEFADGLCEISFIGYLKFAEHLKEPMGFWKEARFAVETRLDDIEERIKQLTKATTA